MATDLHHCFAWQKVLKDNVIAEKEEFWEYTLFYREVSLNFKFNRGLGNDMNFKKVISCSHYRVVNENKSLLTLDRVDAKL